MAKEQKNFAEKNLKNASAATRNNFENSRTKFYEARFYAQDNPNSAAAKKALAAAEANMKRLGKIAYEESATRGFAKKASYSPKPMTAAAKAKATAAGKATAATGGKTTPKKSANMQSFYKTKDKVEMAKYQAKGATHQMKINKAKGKLDNSDYTASTTAARRTKDLNRLNDTSKTLGRAKNVESKAKKK
jgi:hypothetical protein